MSAAKPILDETTDARAPSRASAEPHALGRDLFRRKAMMKASTLLERQHRDVQTLCDAIAGGSYSMRESLLPQLACDLEAHLAVEEQLFYPQAERCGSAALRAHHALTKRELRRLLDTAADDPRFEDRVIALREHLEAHVQEQELSLFPEVERALTPSESRALAERMMNLHHARVEGAYEAAASCRVPIVGLHKASPQLPLPTATNG